jgi:hypothetical protein
MLPLAQALINRLTDQIRSLALLRAHLRFPDAYPAPAPKGDILALR